MPVGIRILAHQYWTEPCQQGQYYTWHSGPRAQYRPGARSSLACMAFSSGWHAQNAAQRRGRATTGVDRLRSLAPRLRSRPTSPCPCRCPCPCPSSRRSSPSGPRTAGRDPFCWARPRHERRPRLQRGQPCRPPCPCRSCPSSQRRPLRSSPSGPRSAAQALGCRARAWGGREPRLIREHSCRPPCPCRPSPCPCPCPSPTARGRAKCPPAPRAGPEHTRVRLASGPRSTRAAPPPGRRRPRPRGPPPGTPPSPARGWRPRGPRGTRRRRWPRRR
mmetsp:Transcript_58940/g.134829  ORF Transcript_58940/g.134829 Transcript_58940/m.134829 type:complete len:275 (+) Transcript_58940:108-932(+)